MSSISEFKMSKKRTTGEEKTVATGKQHKFSTKSLELTVKLPEKCTEELLVESMTRAEYIIDNYIGGQEETEAAPTERIPEFDPQLLMNHAWKGKKIGEGEWDKGSLAWGWDFPDQFPKEVIQVLNKGPLPIDKYEFSLNETGTMVQARAKKGSGRQRRQ
jgi:hypothetical protein